MKLSQSAHKDLFCQYSKVSKTIFMPFSFFKISQGLKMTFFKVRGPKVNILKTFTQVLFFITFYFKRTWVDFSCKIIAQGLVLLIFESRGTETANFANFVRFSFVFARFASKTYKTQF